MSTEIYYQGVSVSLYSTSVMTVYLALNALLLVSQRILLIPTFGDLHIHIDANDLKTDRKGTTSNKIRKVAAFPAQEAKSESESMYYEHPFFPLLNHLSWIYL